MRKVRTIRINNKLYDFYLGPLKEITDSPKRKHPEMCVRTANLSERTILDSIIHGALHASNWSKSEKVVERTANDVSRILWRLGYRRQGQRR